MREKYLQVAELLKQRVVHGDYALNRIPAERSLAVEFDVSYMTARKATQYLVKQKLLERDANGRLMVRGQLGRQKGERPRQLAFITMANPLLGVQYWHVALRRTMEAFGIAIRPVIVAHWEDPLLLEAVEAFDGGFLIPEPDFPEAMKQRLGSTTKPLVILESDWSELGFVSVVSIKPVIVDQLLSHLIGLGHTEIDCLNTEPLTESLRNRLQHWKQFRQQHKLHGRLINEPAEEVATVPIHRAYESMLRILDAGQWQASALFCITLQSALGATRAFYERGVSLGREVSIVTVDGRGWSQKLCPSFTSLHPVDLGSLISPCMDWIVCGGQKKDWTGPLLIQPAEVRMFEGESTGPPCEHNKTAKGS